MLPRRGLILRLAVLLAALALLGGCAVSAPAPEETQAPAPPLPSPTPIPSAAYPELPLYFDGLLRGRGYISEGRVYLPIALICDYYGLALTEEVKGDELLLKLPGLDVRGRRGQDYMEAEGRYLYTPGDWLEAGGRICLPLEAAAHLFGLPIETDAALTRCDIGSAGCQLLTGDENYYILNWSNEDLYWLTHIIYAEAHHESLAGQIGVGNVVLNRTRSEGFPSTITTVVLDQTHQVQFDPVESREVLSEADELSIIAAYLCLEGYNTVDGALYFVNPDRGDASWFQSDLNEVAVIGHHHFYK